MFSIEIQNAFKGLALCLFIPLSNLFTKKRLLAEKLNFKGHWRFQVEDKDFWSGFKLPWFIESFVSPRKRMAGTWPAICE